MSALVKFGKDQGQGLLHAGLGRGVGLGVLVLVLGARAGDLVVYVVVVEVGVVLQEELERVPPGVHHAAELIVAEFVVPVLVELLVAGVNVRGTQSAKQKNITSQIGVLLLVMELSFFSWKKERNATAPHGTALAFQWKVKVSLHSDFSRIIYSRAHKKYYSWVI